MTRTPVFWANGVLGRPIELLGDHAYLEKKAAANALEMLNRWPEGPPPARWVVAMAAIARDESAHLMQVCRILRKRKAGLPRQHANPYASELRRLVRKGDGSREIVDRLLVAGLIEARSCERFFVLAKVATDSELARLYDRLYASECGHYLTFLELANQVLEPAKVRARWQTMLECEAEILSRQLPGPRMHSGVP